MGQPKLHPESGRGAENILMEKVNSPFAATLPRLNSPPDAVTLRRNFKRPSSVQASRGIA